MACTGNGTDIPISHASSSNLGSPNGSGSDLDGMGTSSGSTTDEKLDALLSKFGHIETQLAQIPALRNWMSRMDSHITKTLGDFATRLSEMEQNFSTLTARLCKVETYAASASNVCGLGRGPTGGIHSVPTRSAADECGEAVVLVAVLLVAVVNREIEASSGGAPEVVKTDDSGSRVVGDFRCVGVQQPVHQFCTSARRVQDPRLCHGAHCEQQ